MAKPSYALWYAEQDPARRVKIEDRQQRPTDPLLMSGYWRIDGARTKIDWPVAIWTEPNSERNPNGATIFQIGHKIMRTDTHEKEWHDFISGSWLKSSAVAQKQNPPDKPQVENWQDALNSGRWMDGKPSREISVEEKLDIIPAAADSEGRGTNSPIDENGDPIDEFYEQIKVKLARGVELLSEVGSINTLEKANKAAEILEPLREAGTLGEERRKKEKKPHDDAAAKVQAKWKPVLEPASQAFKRAEEKRLREEAEKVRREEAKALADAEAKRLREEREQQERDAAANEEPAPEVPTDAEIEARAAEVAAETMATVPVVDTKVRVGTAHGRAVSKATVWGGNITDVDLFFQSIKEHVDTIEFLQKKADQLGRVKATVPGMERVEK